ncbi:MAG: hypothetical protein HY079_14995 [Elusimicrobia bacterium]|nr:hypothetical protein [Elusimicrobiota bacterium]
MKRINSWTELFDHWEQEANKYSALKRLRDYYDFQLSILTEPYHKDLQDWIQTNGAAKITPEVMDALYAKVRPAVKELEQLVCGNDAHDSRTLQGQLIRSPPLK